MLWKWFGGVSNVSNDVGAVLGTTREGLRLVFCYTIVLSIVKRAGTGGIMDLWGFMGPFWG